MTTGKEVAALSLARQPIFDAEQHLWGYELFAVSGAGQLAAVEFDTDTVAGTLASGTYMGLQQMLDHGRKIMVRFSAKNVLDKLPYALPPKRTAVKILGRPAGEPGFEDTLAQLKADGYMLVVEAAGGATPESLLKIADIVHVEVAGQNRDELNGFQKKIEPFGCLSLAGQVQSQPLMTVCKDVGFQLFQGGYFKQPEQISVKKLSSNQVSRLQLMRLIEQEDPDLERLSEAIRTDVSISFRLLSYINSAAYGFRQKIQSIRDAINMLGWKKMRNWVRVVVLNDMAQSQKGSELVVLSAQRGKFLEQIARDHDFWGFNPESLFLLGMFSLLDAMINRPMPEIVQYLPLEDKLKSALCRDANNEYAPLLRLSEIIEEGQWDAAEKAIQNLGLDGGKVRKAFRDALAWGDEMTRLTLAAGSKNS
ncbi:MAG: EAL and HDOD domain-containing protein [Thermodesulfobacteriota bacterium]